MRLLCTMSMFGIDMSLAVGGVTAVPMGLKLL